jgi:hypothetical protein
MQYYILPSTVTFVHYIGKIVLEICFDALFVWVFLLLIFCFWWIQIIDLLRDVCVMCAATIMVQLPVQSEPITTKLGVLDTTLCDEVWPLLCTHSNGLFTLWSLLLYTHSNGLCLPCDHHYSTHIVMVCLPCDHHYSTHIVRDHKVNRPLLCVE